MKKIFFASLILALLITVSTARGADKRVYMKTDNPVIRSLIKLGISPEHEFEHGLSAIVPEELLGVIRQLPGVLVEEVGKYHITKPICNNNGVCEPELGENPSCADCKNGEEEPIACLPSGQTPWGVSMVGGGSGGFGVVVAVLDTGAKTDHKDLKNNIIECRDTTKRGIKGGCSDRNGHGTHVAGTIAANGDIMGVAPQAGLKIIKVCGNDGSCWTDDIVAGIEYAADSGAHIISMSLGGDTESTLIKNAIGYATANGVLFVAAAGNDGPEDGSIDYPGANQKVVAVGAIDSNVQVPYWSSRGINDGDYIVEGREVEFAAPGVDVESTWSDGCYYTISGTSMATPHVSGLAAKLWQGSADATRTYLQGIAQDIHTAGDDTATGFGLPIALP